MKIILLTTLLLCNLYAQILRDASTNTILDTSTFIMWQDDNNVSSNTQNWEQAILYCENLTLAGYEDWKLPNINELSTILDLTTFNPAIISDFNSYLSNSTLYWSSTTYKYDTRNSWIIYFLTGEIITSSKSSNNYVRCMRYFR